jgi:hypothetical protein
MLKALPQPGVGAGQERLEPILAQPAFEGLKAILDKLSVEPAVLYAAIKSALNYEELLAKLGFKLTFAKQIHVNDCYNKVSPAGGIKAVLPYYDIPTQGSMPTLVNYDGTVTATAKAAIFFNAMFMELKKQLGSAS